MGFVTKLLSIGSDKAIKRYEKVAEKIDDLEPTYALMSDEELAEQTELFRKRYQEGETLDDMLPEAFAVVREASKRTRKMRHFTYQLVGGMVLHDGKIAEMKTGEGKTLASTTAGYLNAIPGRGVHIVTVNDYLAKRDSEWMGSIYRFLGMTVGLLQNGTPIDQRRRAYQADITYGTNTEFGFDYLRDNMVTRPERRVQRGHAYAIVDEVDSILIDEARTPLIISGAGTSSAGDYKKFASAVRGLKRAEDVPDLDPITRKLMPDMPEPDGDFIMDEAKNTIVATERGLEKIEKKLGIKDIYSDLSGQMANHLQQALKAEYMFHEGKQYVIVNGEVKIVDEFTGRIMEGRRYSEGLHQAIEAKHGLMVREENQTLATITLQNYFRLYEKLSGMTGTAMTEDAEFREIYNMPVEEIPTNRPVIREDHDDLVYRTEDAKFRAIAADVEERHRAHQPVLIGTTSVESSERLSALFKKRGIDHEILNAKFHEREAHIIAQAGRLDAVTIATNMAGRGTDILLGGNPEELAREDVIQSYRLEAYADDKLTTREDVEKRESIQERVALVEHALHAGDPRELTVYEYKRLGVEIDEDLLSDLAKRYDKAIEEDERRCHEEHEQVIACNGLCVIGTERHESRRIDNQLRGRAGRQGDPGESRFYLSLEDDLMRLFGDGRMERLSNLMLAADMEDVPIEHKAISKAVENAQRKVESINFSMRKNVLEYDDVMNKQRQVIYAERNKILDGKDLTEHVMDVIEETVSRCVSEYCAVDSREGERGLDGLATWLRDLTGRSDVPRFEDEDYEALKDEALAFVVKCYEERAERFGENVMRELNRQMMLRSIDSRWKNYLQEMDYLKQGIGLRSYGQRDPLVEYKTEAYQAFRILIDSMYEDYLRAVLRIKLEVVSSAVSSASQDRSLAGATYSGPAEVDGADAARNSTVRQAAPARADRAPQPGAAKTKTYVKSESGDPYANVGRNDPCPCGSGKKFKKCHGRDR